MKRRPDVIEIMFFLVLVIMFFYSSALHSKITPRTALKKEFTRGMLGQGIDQLMLSDQFLEPNFNSPMYIVREETDPFLTNLVNLESWRIKIMNKFSRQSERRLSECHSFLQLLAEKVLEKYDVTILEGHRGKGRQNKLFHEGKSDLKFPDGMHNKRPSLAIDMAPYPIDWKDIKRFYHFAGYVQAQADAIGIKVRWGGDWDMDRDFNDQHLMDLVHFELVF